MSNPCTAFLFTRKYNILGKHLAFPLRTVSTTHSSTAVGLKNFRKEELVVNSKWMHADYLSNGWSTSWDDWSSRLWMKIESLPSTASLSSPGSLSPFIELLGLLFAKAVSGSEAVGERTVWHPWSEKEWTNKQRDRQHESRQRTFLASKLMLKTLKMHLKCHCNTRECDRNTMTFWTLTYHAPFPTQAFYQTCLAISQISMTPEDGGTWYYIVCQLC